MSRNCSPCVMPLASKLMQQTKDYCSCSIDSSSRKSCQVSCPLSKEKSVCDLDCNEEYTPSGMQPPKTSGPLGKDFECCTTYAPCGCWDTCRPEDHQVKKCFEACNTCAPIAPFGPYGPWTKVGPSKFPIVRSEYIKKVYPNKRRTRTRDGKKCKIDQPMGKMRPWPLAGSCRYAGRPFGPCRPTNAYRSRGPFGIWWTFGCDPEYVQRPDTPAQPCWKYARAGRRPCTPCYRPLFRPCKNKCVANMECKYVEMDDQVRCNQDCTNVNDIEPKNEMS
ncbi:hypothetical protein PVAND_005666 [Polypedilum vanderplanki]|uniref:Uncharacterized protein n=1 Tax=Polypedilum vanderplanki TaxID=319348 RepID=A0A9J6C1M5_POLVA|nr:hypothetical protein PVAND_005666 [Polypedilum vanderplanki]